ncbi:MAG: hypothetical protein M3P49_04860 [Actinomycetota bacterium]|nr:hypothetical protein [Actinomycetota bacterium]
MTYYERAELLGLWEEAQGELSAAIEDFRFARDMLGRLGEEERERFSEAGWAWGDMSWTGGSLVDVYDGQLLSVLATLGWDLSGEFYHQYVEEGLGEATVLADLLRPDGKPLAEEDYDPPGAYTEDVLVVEIRGGWPELRRLRAGLARVEPDLRVYHHRPGSERAQQLRPGGAMYLILSGEMGCWHDAVHHRLFEWLIRE